MSTRRSRDLLIAAIVLCAVGRVIAQDAARRVATPVDPIGAIIDAFQSHSIVALGEGPHTNEQGHAFRLALIRDPRFAAVVSDIVVESGSARYQDVIDRFVRGAAVPDDAIRDVLENTVGAAPVWDRPMYAEFFQAVRAINSALPAERQLRVLLGDPPIDWSVIKTRDDYLLSLRQRDSHPADLIQREVLAKNGRALVIYGDGHFQARSERPARSLAGLLESAGARMFAITSTFADLTSNQSDMSSWRAPALALLRGTRLGAVPYERFFGPAPPTPFFRGTPFIEDHFDAILYLGPESSMTTARLSYPRCAEPEYVQMRVARMMLSGSPPTVADRLRSECMAAAKR